MPTSIVIDEPLTTWYCDKCGEPIVRATPHLVPSEQTGLVAWAQPRIKPSDNPDEDSERSLAVAYKVLHKSKCDEILSDATWDADSLLGLEGLQRWSELLWNGASTDPFRLSAGSSLNPTVDLMFRFQIPYYEQARRYTHTESAQQIMGGRVVLSNDDWRQIITEGHQELEEGL